MRPFLLANNAITLPSYLVINSLAFCIAVYWYYRRAALKKLNQNSALDLALAIMFGGFIGARALHIFFERPDIYWRHPGYIWRVWYGGFVFYGGAFGAWLAARLVSTYRHFDFYKYADLAAPVLLLGYALGRIGCLAAGCCYGLPTTMPWGISFPKGVEAPSGIALHPTQIYSSLWALVSLMIVLVYEKRQDPDKRGVHRQHADGPNVKSLASRRPGQIFGLAIMLHGFGRATIEQFRGDFRGAEPLNLSISTWLSAVTLIYGIWLVAVGPHKRFNDDRAPK